MTELSGTAHLSPLKRADGSASYSANGHSVVCAINGPVEVQRRDELPDEATIDVTIRPFCGISGIREKHFESIIHSTLRSTVLLSAHPRSLIQVTLQVASLSDKDTTPSGMPEADSNLNLLPALLGATSLALLTTSISLSMTFTSVLVHIDDNGHAMIDPAVLTTATVSSTHVLAFSSLGDLLVVESEGEFDFEAFEEVVALGKRKCCQNTSRADELGDVDMISEDGLSKQGMTRSLIGEKLAQEQRWKGSLSAG